MNLLILNNLGSFSLIPYIKGPLERDGFKVFSMATIESEEMWSIFKRVNPDIVFVDFCNENAFNLTKRVKDLPKKPKIIIRIHGYEVYSWFVWKMDWSQVDALVAVGPKLKDIVLSKKHIADANIDIRLIHDGIDLEKFKLYDGKVDKDSIAFVGNINSKKGPGLLRTVIASLPKNQFHIGGTHQDEQARIYLEDLDLINATFHGQVKTEEFLQGKQFLLSTSITESFGMSIGEGMAMGLTPLVHNWPGAASLWPKSCIWTTIDELKKIKPKKPEWCRKWVEDRYSMELCANQIVDLIKEKAK